MPRRSTLLAAGVVLLLLSAPLRQAGAADDTATFRQAANLLIDCLDRQAERSGSAAESPLDYSNQVHRICGAEMSALIAFGATPGQRKRIRGAVRGTVTDAVIAYDARKTFERR